jgi:hypothetical protein
MLLYPASVKGAIAAIDSGEQAPRTTSQTRGRRSARQLETKDSGLCGS